MVHFFCYNDDTTKQKERKTMTFTMFLFYVVLYLAVKNLLEMLAGEEKITAVDNEKITYDVVKGVSLDERKIRLENGYYNKCM